MLSHMRGPGVPADVLRLKAADALANLTSIARDLANPAVGEGVWQRFKVGGDESLWFYGEVAEALRRALARVRGKAPA